MSDISAIALSGVRASERRLEVAAENIAKGGSGSKPKEVQQTPAPEGGVETRVVEREGGDDITRDVADAQVAQYTAEANLKVLKAADDMTQKVIDLQA